MILHLLLALLPVCCFLASLVYLDSYKLVPLKRVVGVIGLGAAAAVASYPINVLGLETLAVDFTAYTRYAAPMIEEVLKALIVIALIRTNRIGFLVDAAICGFAVGAGFAILENLFYLRALPDTTLATWVVRGFGTAIMHGGATAIFAIVSHALLEQRPARRYTALLPGLAVAIVAHSVYNHFFLDPVLNTVIVLASLPVLLVVVFRQSELSVSEWLGAGFDADTQLIELINSGEFSESNVGQYLQSLTQRFEGTVVVDLLCYLRLHTELSMRAKGLLMMRESGLANRVGDETRAKLEELKYLEASVGATGKLAISPFIRMSQKDLWQFYMLSE